MAKRQHLFRISQLERSVNVSKRTILFYVDKKLLHPPVKTGKTMAYYDDAHRRKLLFIKIAKKRGMPLAAIRRMIETREAEGDSFGTRLNEDLVFEHNQPTAMRRPQKQSGKITRKRIVEEGSRIFQEKGFKNTRVNDIIGHLKIGKGSFYFYFSNKEELFLECVPLIFKKFFYEGWEKIRKEKDPYRRLMMRAEITIPVIDEFITILRLSREAIRESNPNIRKLGKSIYRSVCRPIEADITRGIEQGTFRAVNPGLYSSMIVGIMENIENIIAMNPNISINSAKDAILDFLMKSLLISRDVGISGSKS